MNISAEGNFSVATLKEKFALAGRGKENATVAAAKKQIVEQVEEKTEKEDDEEEPLLVENKKRFVLFPIKYHEVFPF
jgi:ribonucleoside-diphosphate reductase subunit M2